MGQILSILRQPVAPVFRLLRNRSGATAVAIALALTAVLGFAGLGTEAASWYYTKRNMQSAADAAAATAGANLAISLQIGRASCRERVWMWVGGVSLEESMLAMIARSA